MRKIYVLSEFYQNILCQRPAAADAPLVSGQVLRALSLSIARSNSAFCGELQKAEFERDLIRERTGAGREAAKTQVFPSSAT
jgi:hypothetical protein